MNQNQLNYIEAISEVVNRTPLLDRSSILLILETLLKLDSDEYAFSSENLK